MLDLVISDEMKALAANLAEGYCIQRSAWKHMTEVRHNLSVSAIPPDGEFDPLPGKMHMAAAEYSHANNQFGIKRGDLLRATFQANPQLFSEDGDLWTERKRPHAEVISALNALIAEAGAEKGLDRPEQNAYYDEKIGYSVTRSL